MLYFAYGSNMDEARMSYLIRGDRRWNLPADYIAQIESTITTA